MALPTRVQRGYDPFEMAHRDFDDMLGRFFGGRIGNGGGNGGNVPAMSPFGVDIREDADHIYVEADLPGFKKEDVDLTLENQTLTILAEKKQQSRQESEKKGEWLLNERRYARFVRSFMLPPTVDDQKVDAKLNDGVLTIKLNKREETKPRKIQVG